MMESQKTRKKFEKTRGSGKSEVISPTLQSKKEKKTCFQQKLSKPSNEATKSSRKKKIAKKDVDEEIDPSGSVESNNEIMSLLPEEDLVTSLSQSSVASSERKSLVKKKQGKNKISQKKCKAKQVSVKSQLLEVKPLASSQSSVNINIVEDLPEKTVAKTTEKIEKETEPITGISDDVNEFIAQLIELVSDDEDETCPKNQSTENIDDFSLNKIKNEPHDTCELQCSNVNAMFDSLLAGDFSDISKDIGKNYNIEDARDVQTESLALTENTHLLTPSTGISFKTQNFSIKMHVSEQNPAKIDAIETAFVAQPIEENKVKSDKVQNQPDHINARVSINPSETYSAENSISEIDSFEGQKCFQNNKCAPENVSDNLLNEDFTLNQVTLKLNESTLEDISDSVAEEDLTLIQVPLMVNENTLEDISDSVAEEDLTLNQIPLMVNENTLADISDSVAEEDSTLNQVPLMVNENTLEDISDSVAKEDLTLNQVPLMVNENTLEDISDSVAEEDLTLNQVPLMVSENTLEDTSDSVAEEDLTLNQVPLMVSENTLEDISDSVAEEDLTLNQVPLMVNEKNISDSVAKEDLTLKQVLLTGNEIASKCVSCLVKEQDLTLKPVCSSENENTIEYISDSVTPEDSALKLVCSIGNENASEEISMTRGNSNSKQVRSLGNENSLKYILISEKPLNPQSIDLSKNDKELDASSHIEILTLVTKKGPSSEDYSTPHILDEASKKCSTVEEIDLTEDEVEEKQKPEEIDLTEDKVDDEKKPDKLDLTLDDKVDENKQPEHESTCQEEVKVSADQIENAKNTVTSSSQLLSESSQAMSVETSKDRTWSSRLPPPPGCDEEIILEDYYESAFMINALPKYIRKYLILKGIEQGEIKQFSGASVSVQEKPIRTMSQSDSTQPVIEVLLMKGKSRSSIIMADRLVKRLISEAQQINSAAQRIFSCSRAEPPKPTLPPVQPTLPPLNIPTKPANPSPVVAVPPMLGSKEKPSSNWLAEKVYVGLDQAPASFNLEYRLLGYIEQYKTRFGVDVKLNGSPNPGPGLEPLHLLVSQNHNEGNFKAAVEMAHNLVQQINQDFFEFWTKNQLQAIASAPLNRGAQPVWPGTGVHSTILASTTSSIPLPLAAASTPILQQKAQLPHTIRPVSDIHQHLNIPLPNPAFCTTKTQQTMTPAIIAKPPVLRNKPETPQPKHLPVPSSSLLVKPPINPPILQSINSKSTGSDVKPSNKSPKLPVQPPTNTQITKLIPRQVLDVSVSRTTRPQNPVTPSTSLSTNNKSQVPGKKNPLMTKIQFMIGKKANLLKNALNKASFPTPTEKQELGSENIQTSVSLNNDEDSGLLTKQDLKPENIQPNINLKKDKESGLVTKEDLKPKNVQPDITLKKDEESVLVTKEDLKPKNIQPDISLKREPRPSLGLLSSPTSSSSDEDLSRNQKSKFGTRRSNSKDRLKKKSDWSSTSTKRSRSRLRDRVARDRDSRLTTRWSRDHLVKRSRSTDKKSRSRDRRSRSRDRRSRSRDRRSRSRDRRSRSKDKRSRSQDRQTRTSDSKIKLKERIPNKRSISRDKRSQSRDRRSRSRNKISVPINRLTRSRDKTGRKSGDNADKRSRSRDRDRETRNRRSRSTDKTFKSRNKDRSNSRDRKFRSKKIKSNSKEIKSDMLGKCFEIDQVNESDSSEDISNNDEKEKDPRGEEMETDTDIYQSLLTELFNYVDNLHIAIKDQAGGMDPGAEQEKLSKVLQLFSMLSSFPTIVERRRRLPSVLTLVEKIFKTNTDLLYLMPLLQDVQKIVSDLPPEPESTKQTNQSDGKDLENQTNEESIKRSCESIGLTKEVRLAQPTSSRDLLQDWSQSMNDALTNKSGTPGLVNSSAETEHNQNKSVEVKKSRPMLSAVVMQLHEEVLHYVETLPTGLKTLQLQQILSMLETAPLALVLNDNQKTELKAILLVLQAALKSEITSGEPKKLLDSLKMFDDILNSPDSLKKIDSSNNVVNEESIKEEDIVAPKPSNTQSTTIIPRQNPNYLVPKQPIKSQFLGGTEATSSVGWNKATPSFDLAGNLQEKPATNRNAEHSKVLEVITLLQGALASQITNIPSGKAKSQLEHVTHMLKYSLNHQDGDVIIESDLVQLTLTMKLLETIVESPDMASSTLAHMKPIVTQIQQYLDNLGAGSSNSSVQDQQNDNQSEQSTSCSAKDQETVNPFQDEKSFTTLRDPQTPKTTPKQRSSRKTKNYMKNTNLQKRKSSSTLKCTNLQKRTSLTPVIAQPKLNPFGQISLVEERPKQIRQDNTVVAQPTLSTEKLTDDFKTSRIVHGNQSNNVVLIPESSVFSSVAYTFAGPITTKTDLATATKEVQWKTVDFIRVNKDIFFSRLTKIYNTDFPNHALSPEMAFEQCCLYLLYLANSPDNHRWKDIFWCVSLVFSAPITIMCENSDEDITVQPFLSSKKKPVLFFRSKEGSILPVHNNVALGNVTPDLNNLATVLPLLNNVSFLVATWNMKSDSMNTQFVDATLFRNNISVACLQSLYEGVHRGFKTKHYNWMKLNSGNNSYGVIMLVNKSTKIESVQFKTHSDNVASITCSYHGYKFKVIGCDFSGFGSNMKDNLTTVAKILQVPDTSQIVFVGDLNVIIDRKNNSENEEMLRRFSLHYNLRIETESLKDKFQNHQSSHILFKPNSSLLLPDLAQSSFLIKSHKFKNSLIACDIAFKTQTTEQVSGNDGRHCFVFGFVDTLHTEEKRNQVELQLLSTYTTFACIQYLGKAFTAQSPATRFLWFFPQNQSSNTSVKNIAFVLRRDSNLSLTNLKYSSSKIASANVKIGTSEFFIIGCVLSKFQYNQDASSLLSIANQTPSTARLVVMGEFNAKIGFSGLSESEKVLINPAGLDQLHTNAEGQFLKRLALLHDLYFVSTFGKGTSVEPQDPPSHILFQKANQLLEEQETVSIRAKSINAKMLTYKFSLNSIST